MPAVRLKIFERLNMPIWEIKIDYFERKLIHENNLYTVDRDRDYSGSGTDTDTPWDPDDEKLQKVSDEEIEAF